MTTRSEGNKAESGTTRSARKRTVRPALPPQADKALARAGRLVAELKALGKAHGEVAKQHSRIFQALLGIDSPAEKRPPAFKLPTFEDLFDERVARSLDRLGTMQTLADLRARLAALDERLRQVEQRPGTRARRAKR